MIGAIACGIDFGTTNSSIAVAYEDRVEVVPVSKEGLPHVLRSVIYLHRDGGRAAGEDAVQQFLVTGSQRTRCSDCDLVDRDHGQAFSDCRQYRPGGACQDARIVAEVKSELASTEFRRTHSWARDFDLSDLTSVVLVRLKKAADRASGSNIRRAVIGFPVAFQGAEGAEFAKRQALALQRLVEAARRAGFDEVELLEEPTAAAVDEPLGEGLVVVVDFGGGTFDVAVVDLHPDQGDVMALQGAAIGGERFTAKLFSSKVAPALGLDQLPVWVRHDLDSLGGVVRLLSSRELPGILRDAKQRGSHGAETIETILFGGHAYHFYKAIEDAKIALSSKMKTSVEFRRPGVEVSVPVTRSEFEHLIADDLGVVAAQINAALQQAGVLPGDVDAVLRTGGSSTIPAFGGMLEDMFGRVKVQERQAFTTVVHGLASHARNRWRA